MCALRPTKVRSPTTLPKHGISPKPQRPRNRIPVPEVEGTLFCLQGNRRFARFAMILSRGKQMGNISGVVGQLKKELGRAQQEVQRFTAALTALGSSNSNGRSTLSAAARKKISLAQKARWLNAWNGSQPAKTTGSTHVKRTISASARRRIAAARWAKVRAGKKAA